MKQAIEELLTRFSEETIRKRPFIVGIDGLGGAGKTSFSKKLEEELKSRGHEVITLHMDDYIVEAKKRYGTGHEEWEEYYFLQWDIRLLETELFKKLRENSHTLFLPLYDKMMDTLSMQELNVLTTSIILIEGIFLQRQEWRSYFDFMFYMDYPKNVRAERVLNRDAYIGNYEERLDKYERRYWVAEEKYIHNLNPLKKADYIVTSASF